MKRILIATGHAQGGAERVAEWLSRSVSGPFRADLRLFSGRSRAGALLRASLDDYDLVHLHHRQLAGVAAASPKLRRKSCFTLHHEPRRFAGVRIPLPTSCPSSALADRVASWATVIPSPVLSGWRVNGSSHELRILFVGRVSADKGWKRWLEVLSRLSELHPEATGLVIGDGPERPEMETAVAARGLRVAFTGWVRPDEIAVGRNDVLLLTSPREADPLTVYEAVLSEVPVVSRPVGDLAARPDVWTASDDDLELASRCALLARSAAARSSMLERAHPLLEERAPARILERYARWYDAILGDM